MVVEMPLSLVAPAAVSPTTPAAPMFVVFDPSLLLTEVLDELLTPAFSPAVAGAPGGISDDG